MVIFLEGMVSGLTISDLFLLFRLLQQKFYLTNALESLNDKPVALDILMDKEDLIKWLETRGFVKQRHFVRMYLKNNPYPGIVNNQYLISGPEFG